jgi:hypothetical protein
VVVSLSLPSCGDASPAGELGSRLRPDPCLMAKHKLLQRAAVAALCLIDQRDV